MLVITFLTILFQFARADGDIGCNDEIPGMTTGSQNSATYYFTAEQADYIFDTCSADFDTKLHVEDLSGNRIHSNDDHGGACVNGNNAYASHISATLNPGENYKLIIEGYNLNEYGAFTIIASCPDYVRRTGLGYVDDSTCEWHEINIMNKVINSEQFFGFECPENQIMSDLRLLGTGEGSVLNNNPTAVSCCELGGYSKVTDNCIDSFSNAAGGLETAICGGNSAMVAIYDLSDPTLQQSQWQYQSTKGITCCDIEYDTAHGENRDLGIDRSDCEVISHSSPVGSFDVACPRDMVLVEIRDNDPAHGVQEVHEIECCRVHDFEAPTQAPTLTPSTSEPSTAPITSCYACLAQVYATEVDNQDTFVTQVQSCLSHCCVEH